MKHVRVLLAVSYCLARMGGSSIISAADQLSPIPRMPLAFSCGTTALHPVFWKNRKRPHKRRAKKR